MLTKKNVHPDNVVRCMQMMPRYLPCLAVMRVVSLIEIMFRPSQGKVQFIHFSKEFKCLLDGDCKEESISLETPFVQSQCQQLYNTMGTELWMDRGTNKSESLMEKSKDRWVASRVCISQPHLCQEGMGIKCYLMIFALQVAY